MDSKLYKIIRPIITVFVKICFTPKVIGVKNIPTSGKIILAGNHTSNLDALLLIASTKRNIHFLAKYELSKGLKGIFFSKMGLIFVNRSKKNPEVYKEVKEYLEKGLVVGIFPEGTIGKNGLLDFKIGAVKMANINDTKIVPFVIKGKYRLFSKDLTIKFLKAINIDNDINKENKRLYNIIKEERDDF